MIERDTIDSWEKSLLEFDESIWPLFLRRGYSKDFAYLIWTLNIMKNTIGDINEDGEGWQK